MSEPGPVVVVTGANGFVGSHVCAALAARGAEVRAVVRRAGTAPDLADVSEWVGSFVDPSFAAEACAGADAVVTTVHPMADDRAAQERVGVEGTTAFVKAAQEVGVTRAVHISTAAVYDRSPGVGDVDEDASLVGDDGPDYGVTKRDTDLALADLDGPTRVLVRPPAILGPGESSIWNTLRPASIRDDERERRGVPQQTFAWVHVEDLASLVADLATGRIAAADDASLGPVPGGCTPVNACSGSTTFRDYLGTVTGALGVEPAWEDRPAWTGRVLAERARAWGWTPGVDLPTALAEIDRGLRG